MYLALNHPLYDPAMEVLMTLTLDPTYTYMAELAEDMGVKQTDVGQHITTLRQRGYAIVTTNSPDRTGRVAAIAGPSWARAQRAGGDYYAMVYEDECAQAA